MQESEIIILLKKYMEHTCSPEELVWVLDYIALPEGRNALEKLLLEDWNAFETGDGRSGDAERWHQRLHEKVPIEAPARTSSYAWLKYAAAIILVMGFGTSFLLRWPGRDAAVDIAMTEKYNPRGQHSQITLQDGSIVYLGADSKLRYPQLLNGKTREITLEGEAFFEIKHDTKRPFIVHTGNVQTQVLGTSFKINAFKGQQLSVAVATGKVSVGYTAKGAKLKSLAILTPGEKVSWDEAQQKLNKTNIAAVAVSGWKDGNLIFTDARLDDMCRELERWYNTRIIIKDQQIKAYNLSMTVNGNTPITSALDAMTSATNLKYRIKQNQIYISIK